LGIDRRRALVEQERLRLLEELGQRAAGARLGRLASGGPPPVSWTPE
jgi:hypothetical protein